MKYSDFEKHIGNKLSEAEETVDMDQLLSGLNLADVQKKRKVRPFLFWMLIPTILIGSYATFVAMDGNQSISTNQNSKINSLEPDSKSAINRSKAEKIYSEKNESSQNLENELKLPTTNENQQEVKTTSNNDIISENIANQSVDIGINTDEYEKVNSVSSINTNEVSYNEKSISENSVSANVSTVNERGNVTKNQKVERLVRLSANAPSGMVISESNNDKSESRIDMNFVEIANRSILIEELDEDFDDMFSRMKINCPSFNEAHWRLALVPEVGVFMPFKTIANKNIEDTQAFAERQTYEETLEGTNFGLYGMLVRDKLPFYLKAGISYSRIAERTDLEYNYTQPDTTIGIISQTVSANGDSITTIMGPIISEKTFTGKNRQHSYIHLFDLPVSVGYSTYIGGFDVGIEAGVKINLMTRATGNLLTSRSDFTNLSLNEYFKKRIDLSYFGGIMIGRNFGSLGDFYLAPRFTYYTSDFSNEINTISQKYITMGVNVGYVYKLK